MKISKYDLKIYYYDENLNNEKLNVQNSYEIYNFLSIFDKYISFSDSKKYRVKNLTKNKLVKIT